MNIAIMATISYLLFTAAVGFIASRRKGGVREFFVAGGQLPWILLVPFLGAEYVTITTTVGAAEMAHKSGVIALVFFFGAPVGLTILAFTLVKFYTSIKRITIGEAFAVLFDQRTRLVLVVSMLISTVLSTGIAFIGLGAILAPLFNIPYTAGVWLSTAIMATLAIVGLRGIAWMNMVHFGAMIIAFVIGATAAVSAVGGLGNLFASLPTEHLNWLRPGWLTITAWIVSSSLIKLISIIAVTGMFAAKGESDAKIGALTTGIFVVVLASLPTVMGLAAYVIMPDIASRFALWEMGKYLGVGVTTLVSIGVIAAVVSTTPGVLLSMGAIVTRDIFLLIKPDASDKAQLACSRIALAVIAVVGTLFALGQPSILGLVLKIVQVRVIFAVLLFVAVLWRRIHPTAAFWTGIMSCGAGFIWFFANSPFGVEPLWPGLAVGTLTLIITSLVRKPLPFKGVEGLVVASASNPGEKHDSSNRY